MNGEGNGGKARKETLKISGMHCATCAVSIEKALKNVEGVHEANVNLGAEQASVEYDPSVVSAAEIERVVAGAGYGVITARASLKVGGMMCATCVATVEAALKALPGVVAATVNLGAERAYVTYNPESVTIAEMAAAIEGAGYRYLGMEGEDTGDLERQVREADLRDKMRRIIIGAVTSAVLMGLMWTAPPLPIDMAYLMLIIAAPVFAYLSWPIFRAAVMALRNRTLNMDVMYSMGIGVAFGASLLGTFGVLLTRDFLFYETAVMLATFLTLGRYLEARAKGRTGEAITALIRLRPKTATVIVNGTEEERSVDDVLPGDIVRIRAGEQVPVDGTVRRGESYVDESMITGEPVPVGKEPGDAVVGGTILGDGALEVEATRVGKDTVLARIIRLVEDAQATKPPVQRIADTAVTYFIPAVLTIAAAAFLFWYGIAGAPLLFALSTLISVLVVACPCALGLATPTAITVGVGRGAELGILIKSGEALEAAEKIDTVAFDKTGTLTAGEPAVTDIVGITLDDTSVLALAAAAEQNSSHPVARAIVARAEEKGVEIPETTAFETVRGKGVLATIRGDLIALGNRALLADSGIELPTNAETAVTRLEGEGRTVAILSVGGTVGGIVAVADTVKPTAMAAVSALREMGLSVMMVTGDNATTAGAIAGMIGIETVHAGVLPDAKAAEVAGLQNRGQKVAFVGDGINDAPALAQADLGIAIGGGTDVAIESGGVVLVRDDLTDVPAAIQLARKTIGRVKLNLFWAFAYNTALIPVAAGVLYPAFGITFRPELAGLAMAASSVTVVSLSLLLKGYIPEAKKGRAEERKEMEIDPVCKMKVDPEKARHTTEYKGKTYYFCAPGCKAAFEKEPEKYLE
ncbi:heavy metal translocating P-type ATPase [Methanofollis fontis]|uniref:P-type Cu(+) transporter n=1 Tax=Methanofollis fontis TaxID=2052832 RepID=A0A483CQB2_9EURY|nr:heavy metal translocating P-type ATPase [Methanofollis fontis]TAJ44875.1 copper-translocating P-type ATPase [Methanofollis fontis]